MATYFLSRLWRENVALAMIESIDIRDTATYCPIGQALTGLAQLNFVFGSNGTGKTTISRIIANEQHYHSCRVAWKGGTKLQPLVYNRDFVEANFNQSADLKGVFTLGEKQVDTLAQIAATKALFDAAKTLSEKLTNTLQGENGTGGKKGELAALDDELQTKCWAAYTKRKATLSEAFEGYRNSKKDFKEKVLKELTANVAVAVPLADLEKRATTVFGPTPLPEQAISAIDTAAILAHEANPMLAKRVIGKNDVDIAAMILRIGSSDWVREGRRFYDETEKTCPFCQQKTTDSLTHSLNEYFDETFVAESKAIDTLAANYSTDSARLQHQIASIIATSHKLLDVEKLKAEKLLLDSIITINNQRLLAKRKETSSTVALEAHGNSLAAIKTLIDSANQSVTEHNATVANLTKERRSLTAQVWRLVLDDLKTDLDAYKNSRNSLDKAIASLNDQIVAANKEKADRTKEIQALEKQTTSIQPTVDAVNRLLISFGFRSFTLAKSTTGSSYKLIRANGSDAKATLSEGEKTFITFLYFFHLLKGSNSESDITTDRVVVFDDPVSSLDSDILFIVSSLIKGLFDELRAKTGHIKQIFVLTHNVYFHKEITYKGSGKKAGSVTESFWIVQKPGLISTLTKHPVNPIKTSYELLWADVRNPNAVSHSIQNTLRRILENYFKILGNFDFDDLCSKFPGEDKKIANSLISWAHDGSHNVHDDLYLSIGAAAITTQLRIFREIFEHSGQDGHYRMMMGESFVEKMGAAELPV